MASIANDPNGRKRILFFNAEGDRKTIRLGKATKQNAATIKLRIELLIAAKINGTAPDNDTSRWLASIGDDLHAKLAEHGLVAPRVKQAQATLAEFLDSYIAGRSDVKQSTATVFSHTRRCLIDYFGQHKPLPEITPGDADSWRIWLAKAKSEGNPVESGQGLSPNTVRRRCSIARQFFHAAVRRRLIDENPFAGMKGIAAKSNRARDYFVTRDDADKVLAACPDAEWQLIFALSRYGGLRCPSEHLGLCWADVDWANGRMTVHSPKTEHHEGKESRVIPIFPELRPYLEAVRDQDNPGIDVPFSTPIIMRYRSTNANLRTQLLRIIKRAGVQPWPKLFQNLRATRETELAERFPIHVVCEWIGNSQVIAAKHYLQVTDGHFEAAQNAAQSSTVSRDSSGQEPTDPIEESDESSAVASGPLLSTCSVGGTGLEPVTSAV